ncbi:MAG: DUF2782 domain-containing protein [Methyloprofundus sp.]|nr:DUF2782 domain-containing protein [Methyloprofundus sp.]MBW6453032.1 DUF2782 domain-containing protein [Methyloprofundus sp.]
MYRSLLLCLVLFSCSVFAEQDPVAEPEISEAPQMIDVPEMPMPVEDGEPMDADITITRKGKKTIHEYSVNGKIYKIKIIPDVGPAYYFIDSDGDGEMEEVKASDLDDKLRINQWSIFSW